MYPKLSCWFMFDRHLFQKIEGDINECTEQLIKFHRLDKWCGSHTDWKYGDKVLTKKMWHAKYKLGEDNIPLLKQNIEHAFALIGADKVQQYKEQAMLGLKK